MSIFRRKSQSNKHSALMKVDTWMDRERKREAIEADKQRLLEESLDAFDAYQNSYTYGSMNLNNSGVNFQDVVDQLNQGKPINLAPGQILQFPNGSSAGLKTSIKVGGTGGGGGGYGHAVLTGNWTQRFTNIQDDDIPLVTYAYKDFGKDAFAVAVAKNQKDISDGLWICRIGAMQEYDDDILDAKRRVAREGHQITEWQIATAMFPDMDPQLFTT